MVTQGVRDSQNEDPGLLTPNPKLFLHLSTVGLSSMCACSVALVVSDSLQPYGRQPTRLLCPWGSPGKSTGVGCHALLQGIFLTQGLSLCLLYVSCSADGFFTTEPSGKPVAPS